MDAMSPVGARSNRSGLSASRVRVKQSKQLKAHLASKLGDNRDLETNDDNYDEMSGGDERYHQKARIILK
jgi:multidrug resistance protein, MATE family